MYIEEILAGKGEDRNSEGNGSKESETVCLVTHIAELELISIWTGPLFLFKQRTDYRRNQYQRCYHHQ
jgi:hypothetical protein